MHREWFVNNILNRKGHDNPAKIIYDSNGKPVILEWYVDGILDRKERC